MVATNRGDCDLVTAYLLLTTSAFTAQALMFVPSSQCKSEGRSLRWKIAC